MIKIYTDGSSRYYNEEWIGAYAYAIYNDDIAIYQESKLLTPATVNVCELVAVSNSIVTSQKLFGDEPITIYSDSKYVVDGYRDMKKQKKNKPYWNLLYNVSLNHEIKIEHVKAHGTSNQNNHVDKLAKEKLRSVFA